MLTVFLPLVIVRWIQFAAVFVLFGSSFFWLYMGNKRFAAGPGGLSRTLRATVILLRFAAPIAALSAIAWIGCLLINMTSDVHSITDAEDLRLFFFETPFGTVSFVRLTLLAAAIVIVFLPWHNRTWFFALLIIGAILLITQAWFGHSADSRGFYRAIMITVYGIHTLAAAAWVGGLPPLLFALIEQRRFGSLEARESALDILARFSLMAMTAVSLLVASGAANAVFRVNGSLGKLFELDLWRYAVQEIGPDRGHARLCLCQSVPLDAKAPHGLAERNDTNRLASEQHNSRIGDWYLCTRSFGHAWHHYAAAMKIDRGGWLDGAGAA